MQVVSVGRAPLGVDEVVRVARGGARVVLDAAARDRVVASRTVIDALAVDPQPHYGVSTGFGALATTFIAPDERTRLQRSLIRSHAAGTGPEVEREVVRALMLLRIQTLATGRTGVRESTLDAYLAVLNAGITPVVHEYGSLGCSGDLAPLAHCALVLMGEGRVRDADGEPREAADALAAAGIAPVELAEKEGLALVNGTDGMLGMLALALHDLATLLATADVAAAMSTEALLGTDAAWAADLVALRPQAGQQAAAANLVATMAGSTIRESHRGPEHTVVQDAYSLRCAPQVHGAARDTWSHAAQVAERELAAAIDNPVVTADGRVESNGNFHGAPVGYVLDFLAIAVADVASMSERRTDRLLDPKRSHGLPAFLADDAGVDSGLMIAQYTAAGLVSELKRLAVPASVDSIPSSAMQEDHVSMGWHAARKLRRGIDALAAVLGVEVLSAARALDLRAPLAPAPATAAVVARLREQVAGPGPDRFLAPEIEVATALVRDGAVRAAAESATGPLH
ncbi:histidine ammonia-lyase [Amnibacterium kyonggiense]|uniref:Histidine ammonia-lyase n=1 Tax=Amnibacterium kyonggiense TaxID=595671 RepID=A0A4R7FLX8_9MICO|nr:histidine ammonia-lyase [Amnibacterium kyonggiense]TDS77435.1 histidine ammonia-lyase [Amnibacterium kyonggiense]